MSKGILYILIFIVSLSSLAPNFQGAQFLKIPIVLEHFKKHKILSKDKNVSFWSFIKEHYIEKIDTNQVEHDDLPFKGNINHFMPISVEYFYLETIFEEVFNILYFKISNNYNNFFKSLHLFTIWNPPRF